MILGDMKIMGINPLRECMMCKGTGYMIIKHEHNTSDRWERILCPRCKGRGYIRDE
jgi:DnaJ-class molecular chaperone